MLFNKSHLHCFLQLVHLDFEMFQEGQWVKVFYEEKLYIGCVVMKNMERRLICVRYPQHVYGNGKPQLFKQENDAHDYENVYPSDVIPHTVQVARKFM